MKIAVLDDYQNAFRGLECVRLLKDHEIVVYHDTEKDPDRLAQRLQGCDAVVLTQQRSPFPRAVIDKLPQQLKLIAQTGRNANHIDIAACAQRGIIVTGRGGGTSHATAELAWGLIIASLRHIPHEVAQLKQGVWQTTVGTGLRGKTLGVFALGKIGECVAEVGKAFGMNVTCWGREASRAKAAAAGYRVPASREEFFAEADVVSLHIPLNKETRGIVTAGDLKCMKPTALLVNTSRGPLVDQQVLLRALDEGRPGFAAIDVYEEEPVIGGGHPLLQRKNVICTPHLGYVTRETYESYYGTVVESILGFAAGKPVNVINP
jgi:D-3-phosphoglycerate dehydrogenase / 2-oxoglutarate reductase